MFPVRFQIQIQCFQSWSFKTELKISRLGFKTNISQKFQSSSTNKEKSTQNSKELSKFFGTPLSANCIHHH